MGDVVKVDFGAKETPDGEEPSGDQMRLVLDKQAATFTIEFTRPVETFVMGVKEAEGLLTALAGMLFKLRE